MRLRHLAIAAMLAFAWLALAAPAVAVPITIYEDLNSSGDYDPGEERTGAVGGNGGSTAAAAAPAAAAPAAAAAAAAPASAPAMPAPDPFAGGGAPAWSVPKAEPSRGGGIRGIHLAFIGMAVMAIALVVVLVVVLTRPQPAGCTTNAQCPAGTICSAGVCVSQRQR